MELYDGETKLLHIVEIKDVCHHRCDERVWRACMEREVSDFKILSSDELRNSVEDTFIRYHMNDT